jgi:molecular chaperone DnaJ
MTTKRDFYDILGISRTANEEEIRKAFRRKAFEFHPDRNSAPNAAEEFKQVNEAYQILTNPDKRAQYDQFGHAGLGSQAGASGFGQNFDMDDILGGYGSIFESFFGGRSGTQHRRNIGSDIETGMHISFTEAAFGVSKEVIIKRMELCTRCDGNRNDPGHESSVCPDCQGSGRVRRVQKTVFGQFMQQGGCPRCHGEGTLLTKACSACNGAGMHEQKREIRVNIPAGVENSTRVQLRGEGDAGGQKGSPGDLYIRLNVEPHPLFQRSGYDIFYELELTFPQIALGDEILVPTLEGEIALKVPAGTQSSTTFRLRGHGIPHLQRSSRRGDELVTVRVKTPDRLSNEQRELLQALHLTFRNNGDRKNKKG